MSAGRTALVGAGMAVSLPASQGASWLLTAAAWWAAACADAADVPRALTAYQRDLARSSTVSS